MVSMDELKGKKVVGANALILGDVEGGEVDVKTWQITHLHVSLTKESTEQLAFKKPTLGHFVVFLPISIVKAVGDVVSLDKSIIELKGLLEVKK
jgi:sporulation protein YlmC with PRC-barrel domain